MPQRQRIVRPGILGHRWYHVIHRLPRPSRRTPTAERGDFDLNNACRDTNIPEVTLLIMIKHLTGSKRLGVKTFRR